MEKTSLRVTVCLVLFVLIVIFLSSAKTAGLGESAFRGIRRPGCAFGRCTGKNSGKRAFSTAAMERVLTEVRN